MTEVNDAPALDLRPFFGGLVPSLIITARFAMPLETIERISGKMVPDRDFSSAILNLPSEMRGLVALFVTPGEPDSEVQFYVLPTPARADEGTEGDVSPPSDADTAPSPSEYLWQYAELLSLVHDVSPRRVHFECRSSLQVPRDDFLTKFPIPYRIWRGDELPVGDLIGARFSLTRRGISNAWIAFDVEDERLNVQCYARKRTALDERTLPRIWEDFSAFHAASLEAAAEEGI